MNRYLPLLIALFAFLILQPIALTVWGAGVPLNILMLALLAATVYAIGPGKSLVVAALVLAAVIAVLRLLNETSPNTTLLVASYGLSFALMILLVLARIVALSTAGATKRGSSAGYNRSGLSRQPPQICRAGCSSRAFGRLPVHIRTAALLSCTGYRISQESRRPLAGDKVPRFTSGRIFAKLSGTATASGGDHRRGVPEISRSWTR
jgi:hypothetical protein